MAECGCSQELNFTGQSPAYKRILWLVISINLGMFLVELLAGQMSHSMALQADALDFLGDSLTYSLSLFVIGRTLRWRASAALIKGLSLAAMGTWVFGSTIYRVFTVAVPDELVMGTVAMAAFVANVSCALLLLAYRDGDANVRSVWLCSRNDAIGNLAVIAAAAGVLGTQSRWPDLAVAFGMSMLFLYSASQIARQAWAELW